MLSAAGNEDAGHRRRNVMVARAGRSSTYHLHRPSASPTGGLISGRTSKPRLTRKQFGALLASIFDLDGED